MTKMLTRQEIFNRAWQVLVVDQQGKRSLTDDDPYACRYRGSEGRRCAVGVFIPDELYEKAFEPIALWTVFGQPSSNPDYEAPRARFRAALLAGGVPDGAEDLMHALQKAHDTAYGPPISMAANLRSVARRLSLSAPDDSPPSV